MARFAIASAVSSLSNVADVLPIAKSNLGRLSRSSCLADKGDYFMKRNSEWTLTIAASRNDGITVLFESAAGAHAQVKPLLDSELALLESTLVVPRAQAEELLDAMTPSESDERDKCSWMHAAID